MRLFRLPKRDPRYLENETPRQRFFRYILIALLFCAVGWGFWLNNQRRVEMLKKNIPMQMDYTGTLSREQKNALSVYADKFRDVYGMDFIVTIREDPFPDTFLPEERPQSLLLGLSPKNKQTRFEAPPLAEAALGRPLVLYLRHVHFLPYFVRNAWPEGLQAALNLITRRLDAALTKPGPRQAALQETKQAP